jgi:hypothetical protein
VHCICLRRPYLSLQLTTRALPSDGNLAPPRQLPGGIGPSASRHCSLPGALARSQGWSEATNQDTRRVYRLCIGADFGFWSLTRRTHLSPSVCFQGMHRTWSGYGEIDARDPYGNPASGSARIEWRVGELGFVPPPDLSVQEKLDRYPRNAIPDFRFFWASCPICKMAMSFPLLPRSGIRLATWRTTNPP